MDRKMFFSVTPPNIFQFLTHCGRMTQICVFSTVKLGTSASSPQCHSTRGNVSRVITPSSTTRVFGEYFLKISVHKNRQRISYKFLKAAHLLRSWVRIPPGAWIFVRCECRVLSGRGLCDELITRPEESYRLCCVVVYDLETSRMGAPYIYDIRRLRVKLSSCTGSKFYKTDSFHKTDILKNLFQRWRTGQLSRYTGLLRPGRSGYPIPMGRYFPCRPDRTPRPTLPPIQWVPKFSQG